MAEKLTGIFTPTLVPIDAQGQINETELRRFISWLISSGVHGLYPNGSTGEVTRFYEGRAPGNGAVLATAGDLVFWGTLSLVSGRRRFRSREPSPGVGEPI